MTGTSDGIETDPAEPATVSVPADPPAPISIGRLKRRADFLRAAKGGRWHGKTLSLQAGQSDVPTAVRIGLTVTKKVGCAVVRNRARRRLREAIRLTEALPVKPGHDYVIVARIEAVRARFSTLSRDVTRAITDIHADARPRAGSKRPKRTRQTP